MEVSFGVLKHLLKKKDLIAVFENRLKLGYKTYSIINHAELVNVINPADGDPWDLVIPVMDIHCVFIILLRAKK